MKRLTLTLFLILPLFATGQEHRIGLDLALNNSFITHQDNYSPQIESRVASSAGVQYSIRKKKFQYGLGLTYVQRGYSIRTTYFVLDTSVNGVKVFPGLLRFYNDYISLPLSGSFVVGKRFYGQFGLGLIPAFLVSVKTGLHNEPLRKKSKSNGGPSMFDLGGQLNLGCGFKIDEKWSVFSRLSIYRSITKVNNENYYRGTDFRNAATSLGIGIEYQIK